MDNSVPSAVCCNDIFGLILIYLFKDIDVPSAGGLRAPGTSPRWRAPPRETPPSSSPWAAGPASSSPDLNTHTIKIIQTLKKITRYDKR